LGNLDEKTISSSSIYDGKIIKVRLDKVRLSDGKEGYREIVEMTSKGAVAIVPLVDDRVYFVKQYRKSLEKALLEIPAGRVDAGEEPADSARRELTEEIGFWPNKLEQIAFFYSSPGFSDEVIYLYLARDLVKHEAASDEGEFLEIQSIPLSEALKMISNGEIEDGKTITGLLLASFYLSQDKK
jgi:ADP-ribose pyrophosphatase